MLKNIIEKVARRYNIGKPRVVVGVPSGITEVEERAVEESILQAGAKEVYLLEEPMAAAIGASIDVEEPSGSIIVDIGGGTTEVAVISLGGVVISHSLRVAGDELDEDIVNYIKREMNLAIGETTTIKLTNEKIKGKIQIVKTSLDNNSINGVLANMQDLINETRKLIEFAEKMVKYKKRILINYA